MSAKAPFYAELHEVSRDFISEVDFRVRSAQRAIELLSMYQEDSRKDLQEATSIRFISTRYAVLELCAILDGGALALSLHRNKSGKYVAQRAKLKQLFPTVTSQQIDSLEKLLAALLKRHSRLIDRLFHTRNKRVAHAGLPRHVLDAKSLSSHRFPKAKFNELASGLWWIFTPIIGGHFDGFGRIRSG